MSRSTRRNMVGRVTAKLATPVDLISDISNQNMHVRLTRIELHFTGAVAEGFSRYQHFTVNILSAFTNIGGQGEHEADDVEAELVGRAERQASHDGYEAELDVYPSELTCNTTPSPL